MTRLVVVGRVTHVSSGHISPRARHPVNTRLQMTQILRSVRPRFATFEVCLTGDSQPTPPLPWSLDGTDSYLATADQLRDTIAASGFETLEWVDETPWVLRWFEDLGKRIASGGSAATLPALLNDGPTRMMNFAVALTTGVVSVQRGSFIRPDPPRYPR
jgi:hypothetical protein